MDARAKAEYDRRMITQQRIAQSFRDENVKQQFLDMAPRRIRLELEAEGYNVKSNPHRIHH